MLTKKSISLIAFSLCSMFFVTQSAFAVLSDTRTWSYTDYSHGSYVPKKGTHKYYNFDRVSSRGNWVLDTDVIFTLDDHNVKNILDYNNGGDNPGTAADNKKAYLTVDQTAIPQNSNDLEIDGYQVLTNLPNPKIDLEINGFGVDVDETEVVALGSVKAGTEYYMWSYWDDYRDGGTYDGGKIQAQFAMSVEGWSDYNNVVQSDVIQSTMPYGDDYAKK
jgi:hypothetical protein